MKKNRAQEKLSAALFEAIKNNDINAALKLLNRGVDLQAQNDNGYTPVRFAAQQGRRDLVRLFLKQGANIGHSASDMLEILGQAGPALIWAIGCYDGNSRKNLVQEGLDYLIETQKLEIDRTKKLKNIASYIGTQQKIPSISHHIYFTSFTNFRTIDSISLNKTTMTLKKLDSIASWVHYFWTNDIGVIPAEITNLHNVEIHLINELQNSTIYPELMQVLATAEDKASFVTASDIARIMALENGGIYFDLDYEIYRPEKLLPLMQAFNFFAGKERAEDTDNHEVRLIGNSILAASKDHPVIKESMRLIKRNYDAHNTDKIPEYVKFPCSKGSEVAYKSGGPVISTAYYLAANKNTTDIVLQANAFYNEAYAWSITPESICHRHVAGISITLDKEAIGADMFCGNWTNTNMIYYPKNLNAYLANAAFLGYTRIAEFFLKQKGADIEDISTYSSTALYAAAHNGHADTVEFLLRNGANIENKGLRSSSPLAIAIENGHLEVVQLLLSYGADINSAAPGVNLIQFALQKGHVKIAELLHNAIGDVECYAGETRKIFTSEAINYDVSNRKLMEDSEYKLSHLSEFIGEDTKIPLITHQMYFSSSISPKEMDELSLNITFKTLNKLNSVNNAWRHYVWTNNASIIPQSIKNIANVEVHFTDELSEAKLYKEFGIILSQAEGNTAMFSKASDFFRYTALEKFGGSYRDLDYEYYRSEMLLELMKGFNFIGGKEFTHDPVFIGSASISASPNHPIINEALAILKRNLGQVNLPDYVKYPCNKVFKLVYESGPAVITMAAHKLANIDGNMDLIMPGNHLFNMYYANHINPTLCPNKAKNLTLAMYPKMIGADLFCGAWHKIKGYEDRIYYPHNLHAAVRKGDRVAVKLMLEKNVSIENNPGIATLEENIMEILLPAGNRAVSFIGCYDSNMESIFAQEGIDYNKTNKALIKDSKYKKNHLSNYISEHKIPAITHQIYFAAPSLPKMMDEISQQKTIINAERLNKVRDTWRHIIWTNNIDVIPENVKNISNMEMHLIDELQDNILYPDLLKLLKKAEADNKLLVAASDIARLVVLQKHGGIYHDLDYEIFRAEKLDELRSFNFFAGKEGAENGPKLTLIGNAILASSQDHPIINKASKIAFNNINGLGKDYSKYPCGKSSELVFKAGGPIITMAYFLAANKNNTVDIVMPNTVFYDFDYIRYQTPASKCHIPGHVATLGKDAIGADMFCGNWHENNGFENLNYYPKNNDAYLFESAIHGYTRFVKFFAEKGADVNAIGYLGAPPLYAAVHNKHIETVKALLCSGANTEIPHISGATSLYRAAAVGDAMSLSWLLKYNAKIDVKFDEVSAIQAAIENKNENSIKMLLSGLDVFCAQTKDAQYAEVCGRESLLETALK